MAEVALILYRREAFGCDRSKTIGKVHLDDDEIPIPIARRVDITRFGAGQ